MIICSEAIRRPPSILLSEDEPTKQIAEHLLEEDRWVRVEAGEGLDQKRVEVPE
jgi:hypothetical protein